MTPNFKELCDMQNLRSAILHAGHLIHKAWEATPVPTRKHHEHNDIKRIYPV